ncbi:uncharacterized protein LOC135196857 [Macrobrachium nipponense]|uniref:uncharacterized protein LOC135196857 n=1 Tax=Macrobrachium nipponense TaxID=159736 RepID=UPI0030C7C0E4
MLNSIVMNFRGAVEQPFLMSDCNTLSCFRMAEGSAAVVVLVILSAGILFFPLFCLCQLMWQQCKALWKRNDSKRNVSGFVDHSPAKSAHAPSEAVIPSPQDTPDSGNLELEEIPAGTDRTGSAADAETKSPSNDQLKQAEDCVVIAVEPQEEKKALNKDIFIKVLPVVPEPASSQPPEAFV